MIYNQSRYLNATTAVIMGPSGPRLTILPNLSSARSFSFTFYSVKQGDRLDLLATDLYGDGLLWWKIADANPEILDWTSLEVGTVLRLPSG